MNEQPENLLTRPWRGLRGFLLWWVVLALAAFVVVFCLALLSDFSRGLVDALLFALPVAAVIGVCGAAFAAFLRWVCHWPNFRGFLFGLACVVTLIALFYAEEDLRGKWAWDRYKSELEAKGQHVDLASVAPPTVPDDENFAMAPIVASSYSGIIDHNGRKISPPNTNVVNRMKMPLDVERLPLPPGADRLETPPLGDWRAGKRIDLQAWQHYYQEAGRLTNVFPVPSQPQSPAADVLFALSKYNSAIEELQQAARRPDSRFPLEYDADEPAFILLPHLAPLKGCVNSLTLRTCAELANNEPGKALEDVILQLRMADSLRSEPTLISQLVRIAMVQISMQPVWEGLVDHRWSDEQLAKLDQQLKTLNMLAAYRTGIDGERACATGNIDYLRRTRNTDIFVSPTPDESSSAGLIAWLFRFAPSGWFYQNELRIVRFETESYLPLADLKDGTVSPDKVRQSEDALNEELSHKSPYTVGERIFLPALAKGVQKFAFAQESVDLARVACALERYRLAHGQYPETLDALTPAFLDKVPHDVIGGQPLKYRRTSDGRFLLYSVGWNETDDGGTVVMTKGSSPRPDINQGDWVWPLPAN